METLIAIQNALKVPKNQFNSFGKYNYRSCEDILEELKPILDTYNCLLTISDEVKQIGDYIYIEATCKLFNVESNQQVIVTAQAGIDPNTKGMNIAQCFGASSSYARKYALAGMFLLDDVKDADATNNHEEYKRFPDSNWNKKEDEDKPWLNKGEPLMKAKEFLNSGGTIEQIEKKYKISKEVRTILDAHLLTFNNNNQ